MWPHSHSFAHSFVHGAGAKLVLYFMNFFLSIVLNAEF